MEQGSTGAQERRIQNFLPNSKLKTQNSKLSSTFCLLPSAFCLSQSPIPSPQSPVFGNQISVNGRAFPFPWKQWQTSGLGGVRVGVSDAGLIQAIGLELLSSSDTKRQPIQWFSSTNTQSSILATQITGQYRYLDITDLAKNYGWQIQTLGETLQITTPPAIVQEIRQGNQDWGERIVVDLDRSTPWQVIQDGKTLTLQIDAQANPELLQRFQTPESTLRVTSAENQILLKMSIAKNLRPRVWTLANPDRIVIDLAPEVLQELDIAWTPGIRYKQQIISLDNSRFPVTLLEINPRQSGLKIKPIWGNTQTLAGINPLVKLARESQVAAAINGGYFNRNTQLPLGAIRQDGNWISSPILNRGAIAWNDNGEFKIAHLTLQETLTTSTGQKLPIVNSNSGYVQPGIARYTPNWGTVYKPLTNNETLIVIQNNQVQNIVTGAIEGQNSLPIPSNGYILAIRGNLNWQPETYLPIGTNVSFQSETIPPEFNRYPQIIGAGPILLLNSRIVLDAKAEQFRDYFIKESAYRSVIATNRMGTILIATVGNRSGGVGPTLSEIAQIIQRLGAIDALNLDGGSSTSLYLGGQLINRSPLTAARIHNGLGVFIEF
ncbi:phosphodiester glycosidase family protein [Phormidium sp. LEGE 05292]|uniref:phosphodiester glycosidase family protein n=1 Tax=[Phormidium] sp. LEGE 05292 TaxID=767427 RepID=UPI00187EA780|nr:phosphodiester glycosidase family protein [Phormidium sp. LEGE 05292]MBE9226005.1 phosphodiester glycosidase family protein [Phormidium sp. LEGE 05292]